MADREQVALIERGGKAWNAWRMERPGVRVRLARAQLVHRKLKGADLHGADLQRADLTGVDLSGADLRRANLGSARLGGANLSRALLTRANLAGANLRGADLTRADLREAVLKTADLQNAELTGARLWGANREGWKLAGIRCGNVYLDPRGAIRTPRRGAFDAGEFERLYRVGPAFTVTSTTPFTPSAYARLEARLAEINRKHPGWGLKLAVIDLRGGEVKVTFEVSGQRYVEAARGKVGT